MISRSLIAAVVAAGLCLGGEAEAQLLSPGKLSRPHAHLNSKCKACHRSRGGAADRDSCLSCHKALRQRIRAGRGYHGKQARSRKCSSCHPEHKGPRKTLVRWPGGSPARFDHALTGFKLTGKHRKLTCRRCHQPKHQSAPSVRRMPQGRRTRTYLGLGRTCSQCHIDPHGGQAGRRCNACHTVDGFRPVRTYVGHDRSFPLKGKHRGVGCASCHRRDGGWRFKGLSRDCSGCHVAKHKRFMGQQHSPPRFACGDCHQPTRWRSIRFARTRHPATLPLSGGHQRAACRRCHGVGARVKPKGTRCTSCHKDHHGNKFGKSCKRCHGSNSWRVSLRRLPAGKVIAKQRVTARLAGIPLSRVKKVTFHNKTGYPLTGRHITVSCKRCHRRGRRRGQRSRIKYSKSYAQCSDCHEDQHRGEFTVQGRVTGAARTDGRCESCHPLGGLKLTTFDQARHAKGRFPLRGAHRATPCSKCHTRKRPPGRRFTFKDLSCRGCHRDPHRGRFRLRASGPPVDCSTCHDERGFGRPAFDHSKTALPLSGRHAAIACVSCHKPGKDGVTRFGEVDARCESCHEDRHRGQFAAGAGAKDKQQASRAKQGTCRRCHDPKTGFKIRASFNHDRQTRFALTGAHKRVACNRCHHEVTVRGKPTRVYRLGRRDCGACHKPRHRALIARAAKRAGRAASQATLAQFKRCQSCHETTSWRRIRRWPKRFDHGQVGYTLTGRHRGARCSSCHKSSRAISRQCNACHADPHRGKLGNGCGDCHSPEDWRPSQVLARHRKTRLPLTGWHALADCSSCHPRNRAGGYRGTPATCVSCHADRYRSPQTHPNHQKAGFDTRCEQCHRPTGWRPASFSRSSISLRGRHRFPLRGRHASVACSSCHASSGKRPSRRCASCHDKQRRMARRPSHSGAGFSRDCGACHGERSWRPARAAGHRFPLTGRHRGLACASCHTDATLFARYSCTGSCHTAPAMQRAHRRAAGYVFASRACKRCHPQGRK